MSIFIWEGCTRRALIFFSGKGGALGEHFFLGGVEHH